MNRSLPVRVRPRAEAIARTLGGELRSQGNSEARYTGRGLCWRGQAIVLRGESRFGLPDAPRSVIA